MRNTFPISHRIIEFDIWKHLTPSGKTLYQIMCKLSNRYGFTKQKKGTKNEGWFNRSIDELMSDTGMSRNSVFRARDELFDKHFIEMVIHEDYNRHKSTRFKLRSMNDLKQFYRK